MGLRSGSAGRVFLLTWLPTAIYIVLIMVLAFRPAPRLPLLRNIDKYVHASAYAVLALLTYHAVIRSGFRRPFLLTLLLASAVGMADEGLQYLGRVRTADRYDLMADISGAAVGAFLTSLFLRHSHEGVRPTAPRH